MAEQEFIVETKSGSLYRLNYNSGLFAHGGTFTCKQLFGKEHDLGKNDMKVHGFRGPQGQYGAHKLRLKHLKPKQSMMVEDAVTSPIIRVYKKVS